MSRSGHTIEPRRSSTKVTLVSFTGDVPSVYETERPTPHTSGWKPDLGWYNRNDGEHRDEASGVFSHKRKVTTPPGEGIWPTRRESSCLVRTQKEGTGQGRLSTPVATGALVTGRQKVVKGILMASSPKNFEEVTPPSPSIKLGPESSDFCSTPKPTPTPPSSSPESVVDSPVSKTKRSRCSSEKRVITVAYPQSGDPIFHRWMKEHFRFFQEQGEGVSVVADGVRMPLLFDSMPQAWDHIQRYYEYQMSRS